MNGQESNFPPCSRPLDWDRVAVTDAHLLDSVEKFLIITNRPNIGDAPGGEIFPNKISEFRKETYLLAACDGERWFLNRVNNLMEGIRAVDSRRDILLFATRPASK